jgi:hypothetical protein
MLLENKDLNYTKSYVAFLDVLGFKKLVYSKNTKKITLYLKIVREAIDNLKLIDSNKDIGSIVISDSIILTMPFGENVHDSLNNLRQLCIAILLIQRELVLHDIWLRGAISFGDTHFDKTQNQIIGNAYIDAYLLEEKLAKYPRVILDNRIIGELKYKNSSELIKKLNTLDSDKPDNFGNVLYDWNNSFNLDVLLEKDIPLFIDYMLKNDRKTVLKIIKFMEKHISQNIELYSKFQWVSKYMMTIIRDRSLLNRLHEI